MDLSFNSFDSIKRSEFLDDLSHLSGCPVEEIVSVKFSSGCVNFDGDLDKEAVERIIEYFNKKEMEDAPSEIKELVEFCEKWSVATIHSHMRVKIGDEVETKKSSSTDAVLFIHGWRGDKDSFGKMPEYVENQISCNTEIYEYPTGIWKKSPSLEFIARHLDNWVRRKITSNNIAIISHSMGGLIARRLVALQFEREDRIDTKFRQMTFIASPHNGAALASIGEYVPTLKKTQIKDLSPNSTFLFSLNSDWLKWVNSEKSNNCFTRCIIGEDDKVVPLNSAIGLDPNPVPILGAGHIDIVKPKDANDEIVEISSQFLLDAGFNSAS